MADLNNITHKTGTGEPHSSNHGLASGELAIKQVDANHTAAASGKLYYGENTGDLDDLSGTDINVRAFGIGIKADSGTGQSGVPIGGNLYLKEGTNMTISQSVSGDVSTVTFTAAGGSSGIALTDLSVGSEGSASGDGAIAYNNSSGVFTYTPPVHDSLSGFVANEHIDHSGVSVTAGDGLTGGGTIASTRTLNVVGGDGITANANDIAVTAAQTTITSILATDLKIGEDDQTKIDFEDANKINFYADNAKQLVLEDGALYPGTDDDLDLGKSGTQFKNGYFDGTVEVDALTIGGVDIRSGNLTISGSPTFSGTPEVTGTLEIAGEIQHLADTNNSIAFGTDTQTYETGGSTRLDISDSGVRLGAANARVTTILDEDNMASDSATALATQQSIKAYVDANAGGGSTGNFSFSGNTMSNSNDILIDGNGDITLDANGADIFFKDDTVKFGTIRNEANGLDIHGGNQTSVKAIVTGSDGKYTTMSNWIFTVTAGITNVGTSSLEKLVSFNTTNGNTVDNGGGGDPGDHFYNQTFLVPVDCDLIHVFGSFNEAISNQINMTEFTLSVCDNGSVDFADKYKITEQADETGNTSFGNLGMVAPGVMMDFLATAGHRIDTGSAGAQSFTAGQKISGGLKVHTNVASGGTRGNWTFVFRTTGGLP